VLSNRRARVMLAFATASKEQGGPPPLGGPPFAATSKEQGLHPLSQRPSLMSRGNPARLINTPENRGETEICL
jgi:hypothetical protein